MINKDLTRLVREWVKHDKIIIAVDFDDTIFPYNHRSKYECEETIKLLKRSQDLGCYIMIHTTREPQRHQEIIDYCTEYNLFISSINKNPIDLPYGNNAKPYYNWQLCDRSGLEYAERILNSANELMTILKLIKK